MFCSVVGEITAVVGRKSFVQEGLVENYCELSSRSTSVGSQLRVLQHFEIAEFSIVY